MKQQKAPLVRKVWRMSETAPQGEIVAVNGGVIVKAAPTSVGPVAPVRGEVSHGSWLESSFELLRGADIQEGPDTVPDDLFDELFPSPRPGAGLSGTPEKKS